MTKKVLITAGLPYSNGDLHVGHIGGCYLPADIYTRFLKLRGIDARYICGSDDHGVAIKMAAQKENKTPAEVVAHYHSRQQEDFRGLGIDFDIFGSTSQSAIHRDLSQQFFKKTFEKGYFEKKTVQQFYDAERDMFLPDRYVVGECGFCQAPDQNGDQCENCGKLLDLDSLKNARSTLSNQPATVRSTTHWFLDLGKLQNQVEQWVQNAQLRESTRSYVSSLVSTGLIKRAMTRDLDWGIPVPLDDPDAKGKVMYVWFDAPIGYISNTQELCKKTGEKFEDWWKNEQTEIFHFVGEDNTIFHCIIWIAMLTAEGEFQLPTGVTVNHFLNFKAKPEEDEQKMSKSRGTAVWIHEYLQRGGDADILRYYLTAIAPEKARTAFSFDELIQRNNSELGNTIGNFINRIASFAVKHYGNQIPAPQENLINDVDRQFETAIAKGIQQVTLALESRSSRDALNELMAFGRDCNKYVDDQKPWVTRKTDEDRTKTTLYYGLWAIHALGVLMLPFMPSKAALLLKVFGDDPKKAQWSDAGNKPAPGATLEKPDILFPRLEDSFLQ